MFLTMDFAFAILAAFSSVGSSAAVSTLSLLISALTVVPVVSFTSFCSSLRSYVFCPSGVLTTSFALVSFSRDSRKDFSRFSSSFSAPFASLFAIASTTCADFFSFACFKISFWLSAFTVTVAVVPLILTVVGEVVTAVPALPVVTTSDSGISAEPATEERLYFFASS